MLHCFQPKCRPLSVPFLFRTSGKDSHSQAGSTNQNGEFNISALVGKRPAEGAEAVCAAYEDGVVAEEGVNSREVAALGGAPEIHRGGNGEDEDRYIG